MDNLIYEKDKLIFVSGRAKDKKTAFTSALNKVVQQVISEKIDLVFRIEPISFTVEQLKEINKKEYFCYFFFPRICQSYEVKLKVLVHLKCVAIEDAICQKIEMGNQANLLKAAGGKDAHFYNSR